MNRKPTEINSSYINTINGKCAPLTITITHTQKEKCLIL